MAGSGVEDGSQPREGWAWEALVGLPLALVGFDADGTIGLWNDGATALLGWEAGEVVGRKVLDLVIAPEDAPVARRMTRPVLEGESWEGRFPVRTKEGTKLLVSVITVPIDLGGRTGVLNVLRDATTAFQGESERERLLAAEQLARRRAEDVAHRLGRLQALTERLAVAVTGDDVLRAVLESAIGTLGMGAVLVCLVEGDDLVIVADAGYGEGTVGDHARFPLDADLPASIAVRTGRATYLSSIEERDRTFPAFRGAPTRHRAFAVLPLEVEGRNVGAISFGWTEERTFGADDRRLLEAIADQCGTALERARLAEAERRALQRQAFLAAASRELASSLDLEATLQRAARLLVPEVASSAYLYLLEEHGLRLVAVANARAEREPAMISVIARLGTPVRAPLLEQVVADNQPMFLPQLPPEVLEEHSTDPEHLREMQQLAIRSAVALPIRGHEGEVVGLLTVTRDDDEPAFRPSEVPLITELCERVGMAVVNASVHRHRLEVARMLQRSLLPPRQPEIPGLDVSARYHPVGDGSEVGGDFYDVFRIDDEHWGVVMGDVSGKGVAAASLTALARYTVRAASAWELTPSAVLRSLNRAILDDDSSERFCTICLAFVRVEEGRSSLTVAVGGHPLPMLVHSAGEVRAVGEPGTGIGLFPHPELVDVEVELGPGDALVLYTDGLLEARSPEGLFAPDLMEGALRQGPWASASEIADAVDHAVIAFEGGTPRDDMAVLVVRMPEAGDGSAAVRFEGSYPAAVTSATMARRQLAAWIDRNDLHGADDMVMVLAELAANAARAARSRVDVRAWVQGGEMVLEVEDDGTGIPGALPGEDVVPDVSAEQGRGLYLVRLLTDTCSIATGGGGTVVRCTRRI